MATLLENLKTRRDAIGVELAALTSSLAGGKPNSTMQGGADHVGYKDGLYRELKDLTEQINALENIDNIWEDVSLVR